MKIADTELRTKTYFRLNEGEIGPQTEKFGADHCSSINEACRYRSGLPSLKRHELIVLRLIRSESAINEARD